MMRKEILIEKYLTIEQTLLSVSISGLTSIPWLVYNAPLAITLLCFQVYLLLYAQGI